MALALGIDRSYLCRLETQQRNFSLPLLLRCIRVLGVSVDVLLPELGAAGGYANDYEGALPHVDKEWCRD